MTATHFKGPVVSENGFTGAVTGNVSGTTVTATGAISGGSFVTDSVTLSNLKWVDVTVTAALLDGAGKVDVMPAATGDRFKVRDVKMQGGGTNFGAGGNRLIDLTDGTNVYTSIANADIEAASATTLGWGNAKVPYPATGSVLTTASVAGQALRFQYSGGTTDHSATGSIVFSVLVEKVA